MCALGSWYLLPCLLYAGACDIHALQQPTTPMYLPAEASQPHVVALLLQDRLPFMLGLNLTTRHGTTTVMFTVDRNNELLLHAGQLATLMGYVDAQAPAAVRQDTNPADW